MSGSGFTARGGWWVVTQFVLFAGYLAALILTRGAVGGTAGVLLRSGGIALVGAGTILTVGGLRGLGPSLSVYPAPIDGGALVVAGAYRLVRHPIYGGVVLGGMGLGLVSASVAACLVAVALAAFFAAKSAFEERHLVDRYPGYGAYRERVRRRLIPGIL